MIAMLIIKTTLQSYLVPIITFIAFISGSALYQIGYMVKWCFYIAKRCFNMLNSGPAERTNFGPAVRVSMPVTNIDLINTSDPQVWSSCQQQISNWDVIQERSGFIIYHDTFDIKWFITMITFSLSITYFSVWSWSVTRLFKVSCWSVTRNPFFVFLS